MTEYIVGLRLGKRSEVLTIEAEDALIAALKAKHNHPRGFNFLRSKIQSARRSSQSASEGMKITKRTSCAHSTKLRWGMRFRIFGNIAVAIAVCQITENETQVTRGIEMMLLVKTEGRWQIISQAWDNESEAKPIPADLLYSD